MVPGVVEDDCEYLPVTCAAANYAHSLTRVGLWNFTFAIIPIDTVCHSKGAVGEEFSGPEFGPLLPLYLRR